MKGRGAQHPAFHPPPFGKGEGSLRGSIRSLPRVPARGYACKLLWAKKDQRTLSFGGGGVRSTPPLIPHPLGGGGQFKGKHTLFAPCPSPWLCMQTFVGKKGSKDTVLWRGRGAQHPVFNPLPFGRGEGSLRGSIHSLPRVPARGYACKLLWAKKDQRTVSFGGGGVRSTPHFIPHPLEGGRAV